MKSAHNSCGIGKSECGEKVRNTQWECEIEIKKKTSIIIIMNNNIPNSYHQGDMILSTKPMHIEETKKNEELNSEHIELREQKREKKIIHSTDLYRQSERARDWKWAREKEPF